MERLFLRNSDLLLSEIFQIRRSEAYRPVDGDEIVVKRICRRVWNFENTEDDLVLEDNFFDMNGAEWQSTDHSGKPEGLKLRSVYDI